jgi:formylmethanofuran dehydrogenase subunit E
VALESSRALADRRHPEIQNKKARQMHTYREATDEELFAVNFVEVSLSEMDAPGHPRSRVICRECGEGVNDGREISEPDGSTLCRSCAFGAFYQLRRELVASQMC